jgi:hypothetical protein
MVQVELVAFIFSSIYLLFLSVRAFLLCTSDLSNSSVAQQNNHVSVTQHMDGEVLLLLLCTSDLSNSSVAQQKPKKTMKGCLF